jgi:hypothetical protein
MSRIIFSSTLLIIDYAYDQKPALVAPEAGASELVVSA